jgi:hypothetical protein
MDWRDELRTCRCGESFRPKREAQRFCSAKCGSADRMSRKRTRNIKSDPTRNTPATDALTGSWDGPTMVWPERPSTEGLNPDGSTPGALQGDDVTLDFYPDGFPKLPPCLDPEPLAYAA